MLAMPHKGEGLYGPGGVARGETWCWSEVRTPRTPEEQNLDLPLQS